MAVRHSSSPSTTRARAFRAASAASVCPPANSSATSRGTSARWRCAERVAAALDAPLVASNYSRLVIDCNRDPRVATSIPAVSEFTAIPGNGALSDAERALRRAEIFDPYHAQLRALLDQRQRPDGPPSWSPSTA